MLLAVQGRKRRDDMSLTTFWHLVAQNLNGATGLVEKLGRRLDDEPSGVRGPGHRDPRVDFGRDDG
jgi:hypothetical protein